MRGMRQNERVMTTEHNVLLNGELLPTAAAHVHIADHGLLVGDGLFETMRSTNGRVFAFTKHLERLRRGCERMGFPAPNGDAILTGIEALLQANALPDARIRLTVTSGVGPLGSDRGTAGVTMLISTAPLPEWPATADVIISKWTRNPTSATSGLKTTSYADNVIALADAHDAGAAEAILCNTYGELCEGTGSNLFLIIGETLHTPPLSSGCLAGITREVILECAEAAGIAMSEEPLFPSAFEDCEMAFLTSTTRTLQPIRHVDGTPLPQITHPIFERLRQHYDERS